MTVERELSETENSDKVSLKAESALTATKQKLGRRSFCRALGAASASAFVASGSAVGETSGISSSDDDQYDKVVNIVEDYDADPTGNESVNDAFEEAVGKNTKVVFPEGVYLFDRLSRFYEAENTAVVGEGDVTFTVPDGYDYYILSLRGTGVHFENVTIDYTAPETDASVAFQSDDDFLVKDVHFKGVRDADGGSNFCLLAAVTSPEGEGVIESVQCPDGAKDRVRKGGMWLYRSHSGALTINRCSFEGFSDNGIYASGPGGRGNGPVRVENCFFRNNNVSNIRLGTPGSYAENCTIIVDGDGATLLPWSGEYGNSRAVWLWHDFDGHVANCDILLNHPSGNGILYRPETSVAGDVSNTRIEINADGRHAIWARSDGEDLRFENIHVSGTASNDSVVNLTDRNATFENCCIEQTGESRDGFDLNGSAVRVYNTNLSVTGENFDTDADSSYETKRLSENGGCALPELDQSEESST
ncbi:right-handed parallel beta-helix repeat-containing protein [Haloprofundus salinisoli]|uniref:right-handed parallel beta-helix repeat-containing protein n=1 Tax=Haloprofundus salinisoli TaxID=2876193 RepID=UPI001CCA0B49|nr:glycosyl hydrolase family 28-related protein [Haloprofundus salinisoli]